VTRRRIADPGLHSRFEQIRIDDHDCGFTRRRRTAGRAAVAPSGAQAGDLLGLLVQLVWVERDEAVEIGRANPKRRGCLLR
jgi:hypothetical protein